MSNKLEIVINSKEDAFICEKAGVDKIELSIKPEFGGMTPTNELIADITSMSSILCNIAIKPTHTTYEYSDDEFNKILHVIEICKLSGINGITVGFLKDGKIDREKLDKVIETKGDLDLIFSKAIDSVINFEEELIYLLENKDVQFIETSGQAETFFDGRHRVKDIFPKLRQKIIIGGALTEDIVSKLILEGFDDCTFKVGASVRELGKKDGRILYDKIINFRNILDRSTNKDNN